MSIPIVAIIGRPNVGKSTLFNRLTGGKTAIVEDIPGVTRDRIYREGEWQDKRFTVIDTGGIQWEENQIAAQMKSQAEIAIAEADVIIFVTDARSGVLSDDEEVANILRKSGKPVILAVNKVENFAETAFYDFYRLGLGEPVPISATHGMNTGDLLDKVIELLPELPADAAADDTIKIAVVGRPNVGKSSLVNNILGQKRVIVSDVPGTTRDAIDSPFTWEGRQYLIIDTAGMRKKARIDDPIERYSVLRALKAIERADVVLLLVDGPAGVTEQDKRIAGFAHEKGKATIIVVNKWDIVPKDEKTMAAYDKKIREELGFMQYAPTMYISALTGQRVVKVLELIDFVAEQAHRRIATSVLNQLIKEIVAVNPPPTDKGKALKISYATQAGVKPPTFILYVNNRELLHFSYQRHIENRLRQAYGFEGNPLKIIVRQKKSE